MRTSAAVVVRFGTILGGYALAVAWLTWPLAAHLTTHLPAPSAAGQGDALYAGWVLAWQSHALATDPARLLEGNIYHPAPLAVLYGAMSFGAVPYFAPVFLVTGNPALALNLTLLGGITLTAVALHVVVLRWTGSHVAGAIAGATFLWTRWVHWHWLPMAPQYAILQYFPVIALLATAPLLDLRRVLALAALVALQALTDVVYVAAAVLVPLGLLAVARITRPSTRQNGMRLAGALLLALVVLIPPYWALSSIRLQNPDLALQSVWRPHLMVGKLTAAFFYGPLAPTAIPIASLALVLVGGLSRAWRGRCDSPAPRGAWAIAVLLVAVGCYASLGLAIVWNDRLVWLPHSVLSAWVPALTVIRAPQRIGVAALMGLALCAGLGFAEILRRMPGRFSRLVALVGGGLALVAIVAGERYGWSAIERRTLPALYPLARPIDGSSPLVRHIREHPAPVVEVPVGGGRGTDQAVHARAMYRSIFHWAPLLNGYSSYWPQGFVERMAHVQELPREEAVEALRRETGLGFVLAHTNPLGPDAWSQLFARGGNAWLRPVARDGYDVLFAVDP